MIRVFKANDTNYFTNGEMVLKPITAIIYKNAEEEYIEIECPQKYADFLVQDNVIVADTLTGKKAYRIHNPVKGNPITIKAWLIWQEKPSTPADRGVVISYGKNLQNCEIDEDWDDVATKLIPVGYKDIMLPEGYISVPNPYPRLYEKTLEFDLSEELENEVEELEEIIKDLEGMVAGYESSVITLQAKYNAFDTAINSLETEKAELNRRLNELGDSEAEKKEKAIIEAQIPLIEDEIAKLIGDKENTLETLNTTKSNLDATKAELQSKKAYYDNLIITDLRNQASQYLIANQYPKINYNLEAHLEGVLEIGDVIKVKHPAMRVDLLTQVTAYELDCLTMRYRRVEFGTLKPTLKGTLTELEEKIEDNKEIIKKTANKISKYYSEFKRDNEELISKFIEEIYGAQDGIFGLIQRNQSVIRQTASEISATVSRMNSDLSEDIASLVIRADQIQSTVQHNFTTLDGRITQNESKITQTATEIRSEVNARFTNYSTTQQMNSVISQTASQIRSEVSTAINGVTQNISVVEQTANKINWLVKSGTSSSNFTLTDRTISLISQSLNINAYVTFTNLATAGQTTINGGNITTGTIDASKVSVTNLNASNIKSGTINAGLVTITNLNANNITSGYLSADRISGGILDASKITVKNLSADSITSGGLDVNYIRMGDRACFGQGSYSNAISIGGKTYRWVEIVEIGASSFWVSSNAIRIGNSVYNVIGFFGASGTSKVSVSTLSTSATLSNAISKINELINVLKGYGLI